MRDGQKVQGDPREVQFKQWKDRINFEKLAAIE